MRQREGVDILKQKSELSDRTVPNNVSRYDSDFCSFFFIAIFRARKESTTFRVHEPDPKRQFFPSSVQGFFMLMSFWKRNSASWTTSSLILRWNISVCHEQRKQWVHWISSNEQSVEILLSIIPFKYFKSSSCKSRGFWLFLSVSSTKTKEVRKQYY